MCVCVCGCLGVCVCVCVRSDLNGIYTQVVGESVLASLAASSDFSFSAVETEALKKDRDTEK